MPGLERRLKAELSGDVHFDRFTRGRYATDASHYQIMPVGVVAPRTDRGSRAGDAACPRRRRQRAGARRRHLAGRPGGRRFAGRGLLEISHPHPRSRRQARSAARSSPASCSTISTGSSSRTGSGFRSIFPPPRAPPSAAWPATIPAAAARCATAPCATTCVAIDAMLADGTLGAFRAASAATSTTCRRRCGRSPRICSPSARARPTRSRRAFPKCSAASAATISTRWCPARTTSISRTCWSAPKARWPSPPASN